MTAPKIRAEYEALEQIRSALGEQASGTGDLMQSVEEVRGQLQTDWEGRGGRAFQAEMSGIVLPGVARLISALSDASQSTGQIIALLKQAEEEAARQFGDGAGGDPGRPGKPGDIGAGGGISAGGRESGGGGGISPFDATKFASDAVSFYKNLLEQFGKHTPRLGPFATVFGVAVDAWEQMNQGRSLYDAAGIAVTKWGIEQLVFSTTPAGKIVELVNDGVQIAGKIGVPAVDFAFDHLPVSNSIKGAINAEGREFLQNLSNLDLKNLTRDTGAVVWDTAQFAQSLISGAPDASARGQQLLGSAGTAVQSGFKFAGALVKSTEAQLDYGVSIAGGLVQSAANTLPIDPGLRSQINSAAESFVQEWRQAPHIFTEAGESVERAGEAAKELFNRAGSFLFN